MKTLVGKSIIRLDAIDKVKGLALYPQDVEIDKEVLFVSALRAYELGSVPAEILSIVTSKAKNLDGVISILDYRDITENNNYGVVFKDQRVFVDDNKIRYSADAILTIVAKDIKTIQKAKELIKIELKPLKGVYDVFQSIKSANNIIENEDNVRWITNIKRGNIKKGEDESFLILEREYKTQLIDHAYLAPEAGVAYLDKDGTLILKIATQYTHYDQEELSNILGIKKDKIRIIPQKVGGAFGGREDLSVQAHIALAALKTKKKVKYVYTRQESIHSHSKRHPFIFRYKIGIGKDYKIKFAKVRIYADTGAAASWAANVTRKAAVHSLNCYYVENVDVKSYAIYTNNPFAGAMRGFGAPQAIFAIESLMDEIAEILNISPLEFRKINLIKKGQPIITGQVLTDSEYKALCKVVKNLENKLKEFEKVELEHNNLKYGFALSMYGFGYGNGVLDKATAKIVLDKDLKYTLYSGAIDIGQGSDTVLAQIAAHTLGIDIKDLKTIYADTKLTLDTGTTAASRQTFTSGNAVKRAAIDLKKKINIYKKDLKNYLPLTGYGEYIAKTTQLHPETGEGNCYQYYVFGAGITLVKGDLLTYKFFPIKSIAIFDVGRAINPVSVQGQIQGGYAMGIGYALYEKLYTENGIIQNDNFSTYIIPTSMDIGEIYPIILQTPVKDSPYGAIAIGEPPLLPAAPAVANAIAKLYKRKRQLPLNFFK